MRYYIIAGEASGDLHGGRLVKAIRAMDAAATIQAWGGEQMQQAGANLVKHYSELAFMGFAEVVKNLPAIFRNESFGLGAVKTTLGIRSFDARASETA